MKLHQIICAVALLLAALIVQAASAGRDTIRKHVYSASTSYGPNDVDAAFSYTRRKVKPKTFSVTVIHTNDVHSRIAEFNRHFTDCSAEERAKGSCFGGIARQKTIIDQIRRESQYPTILADAGDQFQGTMYYTYYKGNLTWPIMNRLKYDVMTLGNHEFDDGIPNLARVASNFKFPIVCANADFSAYPQFASLVKPYVIMKHLSLGIIGVVTEYTSKISNAGDDISFLPAVTTIQKYVNILRKKGIKRIIALSHSGYLGDLKIAAETSGLSLIIGGHSHTVLSMQGPVQAGLQGYYPTNVTNAEGKSTFVVQAGHAGMYIGNITLTWDKKDELVGISGRSILLDKSVASDREMKEYVKRMRTPFEALTAQVIGSSIGEWNYMECVLVMGECALGNLINDAILARYPEIQMVVLNAGAMRASLYKGPITIGHTMTVFPFGNIVVSKVVKGHYILDTMENAFAEKNKLTGQIIPYRVIFAGGRVTIDSSRPEFNRVLSVEILNKNVNPPTFTPLDPEKKYIFATSNFIALGHDSIVPEPLFGPKEYPTLADVLANYIKDISLKQRKPIKPYKDGRFRDIAQEKKTLL